MLEGYWLDFSSWDNLSHTIVLTNQKSAYLFEKKGMQNHDWLQPFLIRTIQ